MTYTSTRTSRNRLPFASKRFDQQSSKPWLALRAILKPTFLPSLTSPIWLQKVRNSKEYSNSKSPALGFQEKETEAASSLKSKCPWLDIDSMHSCG